MANTTSLGPVINDIGNSKLWAGPLGVVQIGFRGYDLGKTGATTTLSPDEDIKDIMYQQDGTKGKDHLRTGIDVLLTCVLAEVNTGVLTRVFQDQVKTNETTTSSDSGVFTRDLYNPFSTSLAGQLRVISVDGDGIPSTDIDDILNFYEVIPVLNGDMVNWDADAQRNLPIQFKIKWHRFDAGESSTYNGAFGYWGDPTAEDVPAAPYPDLEAPAIVSATATAATSMDVVFDQNIAKQSGGVDNLGVVAKVNDEYVVSSAAVSVSTTTATITFPAATFASGDTITVSISASVLEDTETTPNTFDGTNDYPVTNSVP